MQYTVLIISLGLIAVFSFIYVRTITTPSGSVGSTERKRSALIWSMIVFGSLLTLVSLRPWPSLRPTAAAQVVNITGGQWWWETDTPTIEAGKEIEFRVQTEDVTHGMGVYDPQMRLLFQVQVMPGYTNSVVHRFDQLGTYKILCMEYCGVAHHEMINEFSVVDKRS